MALLLPLSGETGELGAAMEKAAQLALFDVAGPEFVLMPIDTKGTPEGAREAAAQAVAGGARLILGPLFSTSAAAVREQAFAAGVNVISFSTDPSVAGDGIFVMGFLADAQVERVVAHAIAQGLYKFAALAPDGEYGSRVVAALTRAVEGQGAGIARIVFYKSSEADLSAVVRQFADYDARHRQLLRTRQALKGLEDEESRRQLEALKKVDTLGDVDFDAVLIPEGGHKLLLIASLLSFYDVDPDVVRFLGTGQWDEPAAAKEPTLRRGWFAAPPPELRADFEARYRGFFGEPPPRIATLAYDAVALAAVLARAPAGGDFTFAQITADNGFVGVDGIFRFRADGRVERGLGVIEVEASRFRVISPPPETFAAPEG